MGLNTYRGMRHFDRTGEPAGRQGTRQQWQYAVQRHAASHMHYDKPSGARRTPAKTGAPSGKGRNGRAAKAAPLDFPAPGIRFTHPDKVLYPGDGITKIALAKYYAEIADWIVPHIAGRPLTLVRCPEGTRGECFYQKHAAKGRFEHLRLVSFREAGKTATCLVADDLAGLLSLVQMGVLEIHVWGSRADDLQRPDRVIFDLDPDISLPWSHMVQSALQLKQFFDDLGLHNFVKTTGGKGLHIVVPIARRHTWPEVAEFCKAVADAVVRGDPRRYTQHAAKAARKGRIFFDYLRNHRGATSIAPYSTRAQVGAPVSVPLNWKELTAGLRSDHFNLANLPARLAALKQDPWYGIQDVRQTINATIRQKLGRAR